VAAVERGAEQQPRAQCVDPPRQAARVAVDRTKAIVGKPRITLPPGADQPVFDITARIGLIQRSEMVGRGDALSELVER
jgi:hypothetical protein